MFKRVFQCMIASALVAGPVAYAGVVTQFTGFDNFDGTCPGANSPTFLQDWGRAIVALRGLEDVSKVTYDDACVFNRNQQARFYNFDGTAKDGSDRPSGVPFSAEDVGTVDISTSRGTTSTVEGDLAGPAYGAMTLDETNLGLPEIKVFADAAAGQRLTVNGFAATEYLWSGETEELSFFVDFDFFGSNEQRCLVDAIGDTTGCILDSGFNLWAGVSTDMPLDKGFAIQNVGDGNVIAQEEFLYLPNDLGRDVGTADDPILGTLELLFTVNDGDRFFLWAGAQAFAIDGGFLDAANTITTDLRLTADNTTDGSASRELFSTALQPAPPTAVDAPLPLHLLLGSAALLLLSRRKGRTGRIKP